MKLLWILLGVACALWAAESKGGKNLGVLDLNASDGVSASDARMIADRLETELIKGGRFTVLERRRMGEILQEQGFQQSGACDTSNCEVQMGQLLGVDQILAGSLGKVGSVYSLNVKLLDVGSGKILQSQAIDVSGDLSLVLTQGCGQLAQKLGGGEVASTTTVSSGNTAWWIAGGAALLAAAGVGTYVVLNAADETTVTDVHRTLQAP